MKLRSCNQTWVWDTVASCPEHCWIFNSNKTFKQKYPKSLLPLRIYARETIKSIYYETFIRRSPFFFPAATNHLQQSSDLFLTSYSISSPSVLRLYFMSPLFSPPSPMSIHLFINHFFHSVFPHLSPPWC